MAKRNAEHKAMHVETPGPKWSDDMSRIEKCCDDMQEDGWTLLSMAWPDQKNAVLVFTKPERD